MRRRRRVRLAAALLGLAAAAFAVALRQRAPGRPRWTVTLAAAGDVMLDRGVRRSMTARGEAWPFLRCAASLKAADVAFCNLECPLASEADKLKNPIAFRADPASATLLAASGLRIVSYANNHAADCGLGGLRETMAALEGAGVAWCGAGFDRRDAETARVLMVHGVRVAFAGFCEFPVGSYRRPLEPTIARAVEPTVWATIRAARARADVVVASFHWGEEYTDEPQPWQRRLARLAVLAGADLVLGHHPHVLQPFEAMEGPGGRRALVVYSLGNFVFDQPWLKTKEAVILHATLGPGGVEVASVEPVVVLAAQPRPAGPATARAILGRLDPLCRGVRVGPADGRLAFAR